MSNTYQTIRLQRCGAVALLTLARPQRLKSLLKEMEKAAKGAHVPPGMPADSLAMRLLQAERQLQPRRPSDLTEEELYAAWGQEQARYYLDKIRVRREAAAEITS